MIQPRSLTILSLLGLCVAMDAQSPFTCKVTLDKSFKGKVILATVRDRFTRLDTMEVKGKSFSLSYDITRADEYRVMSSPNTFDFSILAEPDCHYDVVVSGHEASVSSAKGQAQMLYDELNRQCAPIRKQANEAGQRYMQLKEAGKTEEAEKALAPNNALFEQENALRMDFIKQHPTSLAAVKAADEYLSLDYQKMKEINDALADNPHKYSYLWKSFDRKYQELADKWIQDSQAPNFTTTDINGKKVSLADLRGRYVLLDFWASWCVPCRAKMKQLKAAYPRLQIDGIDVVSVSLDENREKWVKAYMEDSIAWTNTCDLTPFKDNAIGKAYKVTAVPKLFLINPQGVIIAQDPSVDEVFQIVEKEMEARMNEQERKFEEQSKRVAEGKPAPDFTLPDIDGKPFTLSSLRGKYVLLDFWGSWCGWCMAAMPQIKAFYEKHRKSGKLAIVGINCNEKEDSWKATVKQRQMDWIQVKNEHEDRVPEMFAIPCFPTFIIISPEGTILKRYTLERKEMYQYLEDMLQQ